MRVFEREIVEHPARGGARSKLEAWAKAGVDFGVYRKAASTAPNPLAEVVEKAVVARRLSASVAHKAKAPVHIAHHVDARLRSSLRIA